MNTNNTLPKNTIKPLYYNTINEIDPEFNEYKKQQRKKEGLGNRLNKHNFTYNKIETQEEKEKRKKERTEKEKKKKEKEEKFLNKTYEDFLQEQEEKQKKKQSKKKK